MEANKTITIEILARFCNRDVDRDQRFDLKFVLSEQILFELDYSEASIWIEDINGRGIDANFD